MFGVEISDQLVVGLLIFSAGALGTFFSWVAVQIMKINTTLVKIDTHLAVDLQYRKDHDERIKRLESVIFPVTSVLYHQPQENPE
jgi:hypothetical protein